jgi:hypothetical protein
MTRKNEQKVSRSPERGTRSIQRIIQKAAPFSSLAPAIPTIAYDTFWRFAAERQRIFFARLNGEPSPWTGDPILVVHKFTNAYRASDRASQYLIGQVIYKGSQEPQEVFFRTILFKLFNKIGTWEYLREHLGDISFASYRYKDFDRLLCRAMDAGVSIYSAAYIMASGGRVFNTTKKHQAHLQLLERMMRDEVPARLQDCKGMRDGFELLRSYPMIGDFLAYQYVTDINYSNLVDWSEMEFTIPGPGARDGIRKCFSSLGGLTEAQIIRLVAERQEIEFERLGITFQSLWGRPLQLIDIQNIFCETDKYSRVKHPEIAGISGRTRIKQKFRATSRPIEYCYPPKWNLSFPKQVACRHDAPQSALFEGA